MFLKAHKEVVGKWATKKWLILRPMKMLIRPLRAFSSGVPNAKYLAFSTPNTTVQASSDVLNVL